MSEWLGKSNVEVEDIAKSQPSLAKFFPMLTQYFVEDQKLRVTVVMSHADAETFKQAVRKKYGFFGPTAVRKAGEEAFAAWLKAQK